MKDSVKDIKPAALICLLWLALVPAAASVPLPDGLSAGTRDNIRPADEDTLPRIRNHPMVGGCESVFMVTDRETYIAGENVWFSMSASVSGRKSLPRSLSGYAEILNASGVPVSQSRILLDSRGSGDGVLTLPDSLSSGEYLLRGYTRAMTSYGPEHFFTRVIRIFNPYNLNPVFTTVIPESCHTGPAVELYPEGGSLPGGRPAVIAVKTTGVAGKGVAATVILTYGDGSTGSDTIITGKNGTGTAVIPSSSQGISALALIDSTVVRCDLSGYLTVPHTLSVTPAPGGGTRVTVLHAPYHQSINGELLTLAVIGRQGVTFLNRFRPGADDDIFDLSPQDLASGINECLLCDHTGTLLAHRLFMNYAPADEPVILAEKGTLKVLLPHDSLFVTASAVVSRDTRIIHPGNIAFLAEWLPADIMADPFMRPFISGEEKITDELLIMLRDRYLTVETGRLARIMAETRGLAVDCAVTDLADRTPAKGKMFFINLPGKVCFMQYSISDAEGRLTFFVPPHYGTGEIVVYPQDTTDNVVIRVLSPFFPGSVPLRTSAGDVSRTADRVTLRMSINSQVMRIYGIREADTAAVAADTAAALHFYGEPGQRLVLSDYIALPEIEEFFFELIPGWNLLRTRTGYTFRLFDPVTSAEIRATPLMLIDGTCTTDPGTIARLSPYITEYIDVCPGNFLLGSVMLPPIVSLITKNGDYRMQSLPPQSLRIRYPFCSTPLVFRPFTGDVSGHMPRFGNTLLWVPSAGSAAGDELSFTLPRPDYSMPLAVTLAVTGKDGLTRFYTRIIDPDTL